VSAWTARCLFLEVEGGSGSGGGSGWDMLRVELELGGVDDERVAGIDGWVLLLSCCRRKSFDG
jgi:hypothetical protein